MSRTVFLVTPLALMLTLMLGCSSRERPPAAKQDGAAEFYPDARTKLAPHRDARPPDMYLAVPDLYPAAPDAKVDTSQPTSPVCPAPCPPQQACVAIYPNTNKGICLKPCSSGCGPCGGQGCSQCLVQIAGGAKYCMDACWWKDSTFSCPDPGAQGCVDAYSIPGGLMPPGYPGSKLCVPQ
jgi:hypothetical protein